MAHCSIQPARDSGEASEASCCLIFSTRWRTLVLCGLIFASFAPALRAGFVWDDDHLLTMNPNIRTVQGLWNSWFDPTANLDYYPLTYTSWWVEYHLFGMSPFVFHLDNILLHMVNVLLIWRILVLLGVPGAWLGALLFAVHPVHVESVTWIAERKNVLSGLFYLLTIFGFIYANGLQQFSTSTSRAAPFRRGWYSLSLVCFILAILAKPVTMTVAGALCVIVWYRRGQFKCPPMWMAGVFFLLALPMAWLTMWVQQHHVGAHGWEFQESLMQRVLLAGRVVWFYLGKLVWPVGLSFVYPKWNLDVGDWHAYLYPLGVIFVGMGLWIGLWWGAIHRQVGRGILASLIYFILTLSPALGLIRIYWHRYYFVADHIQYFASIGPLALIGAWAWRLIQQQKRLTRRWMVSSLIGVGVFCLMGLTARHSLAYQNEQTLWEHTLVRNPDAWLARNNLAILLRQQGKIDEVYVLFHDAITRSPHATEPRLNMGQLLLELGRPGQAASHFQVVLEQDPQDRRALLGLGLAFEQRGDRGDRHRAKHFFTRAAKAFEAQPQFLREPRGLMDAARALQGAGEIDRATARYRQAIRQYPAMAAEAYQQLGMMQEHQGNLVEAMAMYRQSIAQHTSASIESLNHLAWILATCSENSLRDGRQAVGLADQLCQQTGRRVPRYLDTLAAALAEANRFGPAVQIADQAWRLAQQAGFEKLARQIQARKQLYASGQPFRQTLETLETLETR